jgi:acyl-CoA thioester hydrolase
MDALRPLLNVTQSVTGGIPTQSVGTIGFSALRG